MTRRRIAVFVITLFATLASAAPVLAGIDNMRP
jgi:hypothetical protein